MPPPCFVLLPGLDGTGELFQPFAAVIPPHVPRVIVAYPPDRSLSYDQLLPLLLEQVPRDRDVVLVAESFSGPLALRYAAAIPSRVRAIILCATFVRSPLPTCVRHLCRQAFFRLPPPALGVRLILTGWNAPPALLQAIRAAIARVAPAVLADRIRGVLSVDCRDALAACPVPLLYLRATRDRLIGKRALREILRVRPDVTVKPLDGPHLLLQASPTAAWDAMRSFVEPASDV